jgi:hypothetical protein
VSEVAGLKTTLDHCIAVSSAYKNGKNDGTPESHAIMETQAGSVASRMDINQAQMLARMEAKVDVNLKETKEEIRTYQAKVDTTLKEMKELTAKPDAKIEAEIKTNNEKFEPIQSTLTSQMDIHQARTQALQEEITA